MVRALGGTFAVGLIADGLDPSFGVFLRELPDFRGEGPFRAPGRRSYDRRPPGERSWR